MPILIDAHVHIHPKFSIEDFFSSAWNNFARATDAIGVLGNTDYILALTEGQGCDVFGSLKEKAFSSSEKEETVSGDSSWIPYLTEESESLILRKADKKLIIFAGRQLVSTEKIELLSLFSSLVIEDRSLTLAELVQRVSQNNALPVVPWGVGKWIGQRGKIVEELFSKQLDYPLFLGDNGNRPPFWLMPQLLRKAPIRNSAVLSGSDPLPLASHENRAGSFGSFIAAAELSLDTPIDSLRRILTSKKISAFGQGVSSCQCVVDQLQINLTNRIKF